MLCMKLMRSKSAWNSFLLAAAVVGSGVGLAADSENNLEKSFSVSPGGKLTIAADRGAINVAVGSEDKVLVKVFRKVTRLSEAEAQKAFAEHEVTFTQEGNEVTVRAKATRKPSLWRRFWSRLQVRYEVTVPKKFNLDLNTAGGSIGLAELCGEALLKTAGGSLKLGLIEGKVTGRTAGGSITLEGAKGPVDLETSGGSIKLGAIDGAVRAHTAGGSITLGTASGSANLETAGGNITVTEASADLRGRTAGGSITVGKAHAKADVQTSGGSIRVDEAAYSIRAGTSGGSVTVGLASSPQEDCLLESSAGSIRLTAPANLSAELDAHANAGSVVSDLPVTVQGEIKRSSLKGKLGEGGKLIRLRTSAGSIHILKR